MENNVDNIWMGGMGIGKNLRFSVSFEIVLDGNITFLKKAEQFNFSSADLSGV